MNDIIYAEEVPVGGVKHGDGKAWCLPPEKEVVAGRF